MGKEVKSSGYNSQEIDEFKERLREETELLKTWFDSQNFETEGFKTGIELEAWLVDENMLPDPYSTEYLKKLNDKKVVPEIALFNFELNSDPHEIDDHVFSKLEDEVTKMWKKCEKVARQENKHSLLVGTLPTLRPNMLSMEYLSPQNRYAIMNDRVMQLRGGQPLYIRLEGKDNLYMYMDSVIAECAATSLQIHLGVTQAKAKRYYNASQIASSFLIAVSANSPYFFGKELWDESRIAVFEQAVALESDVEGQEESVKRVTLGNGYIKESLFELFEENAKLYPILLAEKKSQDPSDLEHLNLHNGTIWRWTRPIIGTGKDGKPSLRIEQRTPSAGPTVIDSIANTAFYIGLVDYLANMEIPPEDCIDYHEVVHNFYKASRQSFFCKVMWVDGKLHDIRDLLEYTIYPNVKTALLKRGIAEEQVEKYLDNIILQRIKKSVNGAIWQKAFIHMHGKRFQELLEVYSRNQYSGKPVHTWEI